MAYRKITLRRLPPKTRELARFVNELDSLVRRGKNLVKVMEQLEFDSRALKNAREQGAVVEPEPVELFPEDKKEGGK